jgi:hypothetical protein
MLLDPIVDNFRNESIHSVKQNETAATKTIFPPGKCISTFIRDALHQ